MIVRRGMKPSWIAWWVTEKDPEITAWLAMKVAIVANITSGKRSTSGAMMKNGLLIASVAPAASSDRIIAPCPK